jgi:hypothetical protein
MHALHKENKHFTLVDILHFAKEELEYLGGRGRITLYKIIRSMGLRYKKVDGRKFFIESKYLISKKIRFLKKYLQCDNTHFIYRVSPKKKTSP